MVISLIDKVYSYKILGGNALHGANRYLEAFHLVISVEEWGKIDGEEIGGEVSILNNLGRRKITPILHSRRECKVVPSLDGI
jgi:hypothetical protein